MTIASQQIEAIYAIVTVLQRAFLIIDVFAEINGENDLMTDTRTQSLWEVSKIYSSVMRSAWPCCCAVLISDTMF